MMYNLQQSEIIIFNKLNNIYDMLQNMLKQQQKGHQSEQNIQNYYQAYQTDQTMNESNNPCSYRELFYFADRIDKILLVIGTILGLSAGVSLIFYSKPLGVLINAFSSQDASKIVDGVVLAIIGFGINSVFVFVTSWLSTTVWMITSQRQMNRARQQYFKSLLNQEVSWHDRNKPGEVCAKMFIHISKVHNALVHNMTSIIGKTSLAIGGIIIAFVYGWQMAIVMTCFQPLMILSAYFSSSYYKNFETYNQKVKTKIDSEVIEVFDSIKTVKMLSGQDYESKRFEKQIKKVQLHNLGSSFKRSFSFSVFFFCILINYALGFWYGAYLVSSQSINDNTGKAYTAADVVTIFFTLYISSLNMSGLPESFTSFNMSRISMKKILSIVKRQTRVRQGSFQTPINITQINFNNINFRYDKPLFQNFNLTVTKGLTAIIGQSGSGKTTILNLLMRFYDTFGGQILFKTQQRSQNLKNFTFQSLHTRIGYVGQQPVLIGKTIRQALTAQKMNNNEIVDILQRVKAWKFVSQIGLDSEFNSLSGGQKQRIAIARALVRKPEILILDEGTSALDRKTEQQVLGQLKKMNIPYIIMIAHRLQTIINCDRIIKLSNGQIHGDGTYEELVQKGIIQKVKIDSNKKKKKINPKIQLTQKKQQIMKIINEEDQQKKQLQSMGSQKKFKFGYICQLIKFNSTSWYFMVIGMLTAFFRGSIFPSFAYILAHIIAILTGIQNYDPVQLPKYQQQVRNLSMVMFIIAGASLILVTLQGISIINLNEKLGYYLKKTAFKTSIKKPMKQIDQVGSHSLSYIINSNCQDLKYLGGQYLIQMCDLGMALTMGLTIGFIFCWQITLVALLLFPILLGAGKVQMSFNHGMTSQTDQTHKKTHEMVIEAILNIKTIKGLNLQHRLIKIYSQSLDTALGLAVKYGNLAGIMFGVAQSLISIISGVIFLIGALVIQDKAANVVDVFTAVYALLFAAIHAGGGLYFLGRMAPATYGACNYFEVIENKKVQKEKYSEQLVSSLENKIANIQKGQIEFKNVYFKYPSRQLPVFQNLNLKINAGQKIGIVGSSGSGKSTITNILFKLYDFQGVVTIDNVNINNYDEHILKKDMGIVSQEPVLFNRSIYDNIKYDTVCDNDEIIGATKKSKSFDFICQGRFGIKQQTGKHQDGSQDIDIEIQGFKKLAGPKGSYLSGGQKQRVAIARTLIRQPKIIVLDEATSALDNQNQKLVQEAIDNIKGATQIVIAHRLSTVQNCDKILVMNNGEVVQMGKYEQLLEKKGYFYNLVNALQEKQKKMQKQ